MINVDEKNAKLLNDFFSNAVKNLKITEYHQADPLTDNISHPMFKVIIKFRNHPSVTPIKNLKNNLTFSFCGVSIESIIKEIKKLSTRKATQYTDFLFKLWKENSDTFGNHIYDFINDYVNKVDFSSVLNFASATRVFKK